MLDPKYLQHVGDELQEEFADLETEILSDIARRIRQNDYSITSTAKYQKVQLEGLGLTNLQIQERLSNLLGKSKEEIEKILNQSISYSLNNEKIIIEDNSDIVFNYNANALRKIMTSGVASLNAELSNICKTTAKTASKVLTQAMNKVYLQVQSGAFSYDYAVDQAVKQLAKDGLGMIEYRSGARRQLDTTVRTAVRTAVNMTNVKVQDEILDYLDINLVQTTSHMGARPEHASWQGQVFYRKKKVKGYRNFVSATGLGTGAGLCGWNCRHSYYSYFEGMDKPKQLDEEENEQLYELEQQQRYNERQIREWKRRREVCKAGGVDCTKENRKVSEWTSRNKQLLKDHPELKRNYAREKAYYEKSNITKLKEFYASDDKNVRLKLQDKEKIISKNNYESAFLFDKRGNIVFSKKGEEHEVEFTTEELKQFRGMVLTHNHPNNTTFSPDDIYFAMETGLQEIRTTVNGGAYILRRNENLHLMPVFEEFQKEHLRLYIQLRKTYKLKHLDWENDKDRMERIVQSNTIRLLSEKYGLLYSVEKR